MYVPKSRVALVACHSYEEMEVREAIANGMALLGGWEAIFARWEHILLKPNLLRKSAPDQCIITHPSLVGETAALLHQKGYTHLSCGDSAGGPSDPEGLLASTMEPVMKQNDIETADFSRGISTDVGRRGKSRRLMICPGALEADAILNLCKMKTHALERITGAVKNTYGCVYGLYKGAGHVACPDADSFADMLIDLNLRLRPRLHIMDGVVAMQGNGPASGTPIPMGVLLFSCDPVALDSVFCALISLDPALVPTCRAGEQAGLGVWRHDEIEVVTSNGIFTPTQAGALYGNPNFDVCRDARKTALPGWFDRMTRRFSRQKPVIDSTACIGCGICVNSCPLEPKALFFPEGEKVPRYRYQRCIRCYCCQELCPRGAIHADRV